MVEKCSHCGDKLFEDYYRCKRHKKNFCYDCISGLGKTEIMWKDAAKCTHLKIPGRPCEYEKVEQND